MNFFKKCDIMLTYQNYFTHIFVYFEIYPPNRFHKYREKIEKSQIKTIQNFLRGFFYE